MPRVSHTDQRIRKPLSGLIVPATVRTNHGWTSEEILRAFREAPSASARGAPEVEATQGFGAAGIWPSAVPVCSCLLSTEFRAIARDYTDCECGASDLCETTATPGTLTGQSRRKAAL